jgi:hypothetical protein
MLGSEDVGSRGLGLYVWRSGREARRSDCNPERNERAGAACWSVASVHRSNAIADGVVPTTPEMCFLASRLEAGAVTAAELKLADKLVMALVDRLPPLRRMETRPALL